VLCSDNSLLAALAAIVRLHGVWMLTSAPFIDSIGVSIGVPQILDTFVVGNEVKVNVSNEDSPSFHTSCAALQTSECM